LFALSRRRGNRPVPHGIPVHGPRGPALGGGALSTRQVRAAQGGALSGELSDLRSGLGQADAADVFLGARGEPRDGPALPTTGAQGTGDVSGSAPGAASRGGAWAPAH